MADIWNDIDRMADEEDNGFHVLASNDDISAARGLFLVVHPGDIVQKPDDVRHSDDPDGILAYSRDCQEAIAAELSKLDFSQYDVVLLHRCSSSYSFANDQDISWNFADEIRDLDGDSATILWGDDLEAAAKHLIAELKAAERPMVVLTGAWSETRHGCVAMIGQHLEAAGAIVRLARSACISPDGSGEEWTPKAGRIETSDILSFEAVSSPAMEM